jgi:putative DNA primase/helicase
VNPDGIPAELKQRNQWVLWSYEWRRDKGGKCSWTKVPKQPSGKNAKADKPNTWSSFDSVVSFACVHSGSHRFDGIGFVFSDDNDFLGIDLDACRNPEDGTLTPWSLFGAAQREQKTVVS